MRETRPWVRRVTWRGFEIYDNATVLKGQSLELNFLGISEIIAQPGRRTMVSARAFAWKEKLLFLRRHVQQRV